MQSVCLREVGVNMTGSSDEETTLIGLTFGGYLWSKVIHKDQSILLLSPLVFSRASTFLTLKIPLLNANDRCKFLTISTDTMHEV